MKTNKALITLLVASALWLGLVLGCSSLRKGTMCLEIDESNQVSGPESVSVAAGKFDAMKVVTNVVQGGAPVTKTYWYAPGVGMVKSMTDTGAVQSTTELLEHSSN